MISEPLVLIPPILCDARIFSPQITVLSQHHAVQCALSKDADRIENIATQILDASPKRFAVAGMGMGGILALEMFRRAPERVNRLALIATDVQSDTPEIAAQREPLIISARAGRLSDVVAAELMPDKMAVSETTRVPIARTLHDMARDFGLGAYVRQARAMQRRPDQQDILRKIKVPTLVVCGQEDTALSLRRHSFLSEMIPYSTLLTVPGAAHVPTLEQSEAVTKALLKWMKEPLMLR
jgi:pimeloyl-ACP methyl ester carboxylesterase